MKTWPRHSRRGLQLLAVDMSDPKAAPKVAVVGSDVVDAKAEVRNRFAELAVFLVSDTSDRLAFLLRGHEEGLKFVDDSARTPRHVLTRSLAFRRGLARVVQEDHRGVGRVGGSRKDANQAPHLARIFVDPPNHDAKGIARNESHPFKRLAEVLRARLLS